MSSKLPFLWDKWKHQNDIMHSRAMSFWHAQLLLLGAAGLILGTVDGPGRWRWFLLGVLITLVGGVSLMLYYNMRRDRIVRNQFNRSLVQELGLLAFPELGRARVLADDWAPDFEEHPWNHWHEPEWGKAMGRLPGVYSLTMITIQWCGILELAVGLAVSFVFGIRLIAA